VTSEPARDAHRGGSGGRASLRGWAQSLVTPPAPGEAPPVALDGSLWALVAANLFALAVAVWQDWGVRPLMLLYWGQSVVIGVANVFRMLALERFSTEGVTSGGSELQPTPAAKWQVAVFFALHYGIFHLVYLLFLVLGVDAEPLEWRWFLACTLAFALNHLWSFHYNRELDRQGTPNIGAMMFTPYLRIVPMHITILFGALSFGGGLALLLFGVLKTLADAGMHLVEHAQLQKVRGAPAAPP
jgi:hypothetical protein